MSACSILCCAGLRHPIYSVVVVAGGAATGSFSAFHLGHLSPARDEREQADTA